MSNAQSKFQQNNTTRTSTRRLCEYPITELILGAVFAMLVNGIQMDSINLTSVLVYSLEQDKLEEDKKTLVCDDTIDYIKDLENKEKLCIKYIKNLVTEIPIKVTPEKLSSVQQVIITGKTIRDEKIKAINVGLGKDAKADVYWKMVEGYAHPYEGWSVKQSKSATKSNYSVTKLVSVKERKECKAVKLQYLKDCNAPTTKGLSEADKKIARKQCNELFYDSKKNPYWLKIKECVELNNDSIKESLVSSLFSSKISYPLYEFSGKEIVHLNGFKYVYNSHNPIEFAEEESFYYGKKGERRNAAKLFYKLKFAYTTLDTVGSHDNTTKFPTKTFRVEVRWKGEIKTASPQFQMHELH
jgi:hypothetical protein